MIEHFKKEERPFVNQVNGWLETVYRRGVTKKTQFLTLREQDIVQMLVNTYETLAVIFDGGFQTAERKVAIIYDVTMPYDLAPQVSALEINVLNRFQELTHSQVLGSVLGLDIERFVIGDIVIKNHHCAQMVILEQYESFFLQQFQKIGASRLVLSPISPTSLYRREAYETIEIIVSSYRLDVIVAALTKCSRQMVSEQIRKGQVKHQFSIEQNHSIMCQLQDVISIHKVGRFKLLSEKAVTKSNRYILIVGKIIS